MQALREGVLHRNPFPLLLCHHRRGIFAGHQRSGKQAGAAQHLRTGVDGADTTGPPAVYPPLEPEPLCGALPNQEGEEVLHSRPGKGTGDLQPQGVCGILGEHPFARRGKGDCHVHTAYAPVLRAGERHPYGQAVVQVPLRLYEAIPPVLRPDSAGSTGGLPAATGIPVPDTGHRGCGHRATESEHHLPDSARAADADRKPNGSRFHPPVDIAAHQCAHQYLLGVRLLHQAAEAADVVLRHEADG